jgi:hypothetical protein
MMMTMTMTMTVVVVVMVTTTTTTTITDFYSVALICPCDDGSACRLPTLPALTSTSVSSLKFFVFCQSVT